MASLTTPRYVRVLNIGIVILACIAAVLGYLVYEKLYSGVQPSVEVTETEVVGEAVPTVPPPNEPVVTAPVAPLTDRERAALNPPGPDASEEESRAHFALVEEVAVNERILTIGADCAVAPAVLRTKMDTELIFKNIDTVQHTITFDEAHAYTVAPQSELMVPASFGRGAGLYGYGCDAGTTAAGMMLVAE